MRAQVLGIPMRTYPLLMFLNGEDFSMHGWQVPKTSAELVRLMVEINGTEDTWAACVDLCGAKKPVAYDALSLAELYTHFIASYLQVIHM